MQTIVGCDTEGLGRARLTWNGDGLGWFVGSWVRVFVGSWVALGFVCVSFPRATSEGFSFSKLTAGVETRFPRTYRGGSRTGIRGINTIYYGETFEKNVEKPCTFIKFFRFSGERCNVLSLQKVVEGTRSAAKGRRGHAGEAFSTFCKFTKGLEDGSCNKYHILR